jgi:hypothetical protein
MAYIHAMLRAKSMKVDVSTELNCSAIRAWNEVQKSSLLLHVIWPLARVDGSLHRSPKRIVHFSYPYQLLGGITWPRISPFGLACV